MESKSRTAADILLSLEAKIDQVLTVNRSIDLNNKILSNKINQLLEAILQNDEGPVGLPLTSLYPPHPEQKSSQENIIPIETSPVGFRRTSRPETYDDGRGPSKNIPTPEMNIPEGKPAQELGKVPIIQRVVDKNGKAIFMADVEIFNTKNHSEFKTRTNGVGKYQASLSPGDYQIVIKKYEGINKQTTEVIQKITVDYSISNELPVVIAK